MAVPGWSAGERLVLRLQATKPWRAWSRYGQARGNVLAGGITYVAFFSLFPALAVGFTVFGLVLGGSRSLQIRVADEINTTFGSVLIGTTPGTGGIVSVERLVQSNVLTLTGASGVVVLLVSGLGWVDAMRQGIRAMFGLHDEGNPVVRKLLDVAVLAVTGIGLLGSVVASVTLSAAAGRVLDWLGVSTSGVARFAVPFAIELALVGFDTLLFLMFFRLLAGVRLPLLDLLGGALLGAVGLFLLKLSGGLLLRMASGNRWFAAFAIVIGLLLWLNFMSRLTLLAAAWAATSVADEVALAEPAQEPSRRPVTTRVAEGRAVGVVGTPTYSQRAADRTALVAGAVLAAVVGGSVLVGLSALRSVLPRRHSGRDDPSPTD